jgi:hypothetical protein
MTNLESGAMLVVAVALLGLGASSCGAARAGVVSIARIEADRGAWAGRRATIRGEVRVMGDATTCTMMACGAGNPCCNECRAPMTLVERGDEHRVILAPSAAVPTVECAGTDCSLSCAPLAQGRWYEVTGIVARESIAQVTRNVLWTSLDRPVIRVESFRALDSPEKGP